MDGGNSHPLHHHTALEVTFLKLVHVLQAKSRDGFSPNLQDM